MSSRISSLILWNFIVKNVTRNFLKSLKKRRKNLFAVAVIKLLKVKLISVTTVVIRYILDASMQPFLIMIGNNAFVGIVVKRSSQ
uniref:Transmembrane protein n=1 Tax=Marseillevirus LCMAC101 TaxID=2506602 RepID=A0A481YR81_9VIRU|nr:MAG: hypothetical protein LCMAC101_03680 [Marseillevirus LCMAC101]